MKLLTFTILVLMLLLWGVYPTPTGIAAAFTSPAQKVSKVESRFAKMDGYRVHYNNYGAGKESIVFVHGWTCNASFWKANIPAFSGSGSLRIQVGSPIFCGS